MKNKSNDLHNILFEELERLNDLDDEDIKNGKLEGEIRRAEAMNKVATQIISNGRLVLDSIRVQCEAPEAVVMPDMLTFVNTKKALSPPLHKRQVINEN